MSSKLIVTTCNKASRAEAKAKRAKTKADAKELLDMVDDCHDITSFKEVLKAIIRVL